MRAPFSRHSIERWPVKSPLNLALLHALVFCALLISGSSKTTRAADQNGKPKYPSTLSGGRPCGACAAPADLSWKTVIPPPNEPGEPLDISGTIYQPDGATPAQGFVLFVYQADATGYYNKEDDASHPRLRGWMKTGADGRYEFRTIKPGAYPHRDTPAHIHAHVYGPRYSERSIEDFWFKGDPHITAAELTRMKGIREEPVIVGLERGQDGVWRGVRNITLRPTPR